MALFPHVLRAVLCVFVLRTFTFAFAASVFSSHPTSPHQLHLNHRTHGLWLTRESLHRFSWTPPHLPCGSKQIGFQLRLFDVSGAKIFDTARLFGTTSSYASAAVSAHLEPGRHYSWQVRTWQTAFPSQESDSTEVCTSEWSPSANFRTALWDGFSNSTDMIWTSANKASYALFRREVAVASSPDIKATAFVTARISGSRQKLLGAYRLYVAGKAVAIGPGRGACSLEYSDGEDEAKCMQYDSIDISAAVTRALADSDSGGKLTFALQSYSSGQGGVLMEAHIETSGGVLVVGTDSSWQAHDATSYYNPYETTGGAYSAPRENIVADNYPGDFAQSSYTPPAGITWVNATTVARDSGKSWTNITTPKDAQPLDLQVNVPVPKLILVEGSDGREWFFDQGSEVMGGVRLEIPAMATPLGKYAQLTLSEELVSEYEPLYPMRTGNHYRYLFHLSDKTPSVFELHEYALYRYGNLRFCDQLDQSGSQCAGINPSPAPPPGPNPGVHSHGCSVVPENERAHLECPNKGDKIDRFTFASYGTPTGKCLSGASGNSFALGSCQASNSLAILTQRCAGTTECDFTVSNTLFKGCHGCLPDGDPCHETVKHLSFAYSCKPHRDVDSSSDAAAPPFNLTGWSVAYPWVSSDSSFDSDNDMLNQIWELCSNTLKVTSLDSTTDSNTRERLPYEADGFITGNSRYMLQRDRLWQLHSARHQFLNPTWPTEWHQFMPLAAYEYYMQTGDASLASEFWSLLSNSTYAHCADAHSGLVDFSHCSRDSHLWPSTRDIVDWPSNSRDGYKMTDVNTVINSFMVASASRLAKLGRLVGRKDEADALDAQAQRTAKAMQKLLIDSKTHLFVDGLLGAETHSAWHAQTMPLWFGIAPPTSQSAMFEFLTNKGMAGSVYGAYSMFMALYAYDNDHGHGALELLTTCEGNSYCGMLKVNATATMEAWTRKEKPNLSWSHPWASSPTTAIVRGFFGFWPVSPAFSSWSLKPQPGNVSWAEIRVPTASGSFHISLNQTLSMDVMEGMTTHTQDLTRNTSSTRNEDITSTKDTTSITSMTVTVAPPANTQGRVCLPLLGSTSTQIIVDGNTRNGEVEGDYVCLSDITPAKGSHSVTLQRKG